MTRMANTVLDEPVRLTCAQCHGQFRVRARSVLRPGVKSTCATCGTRFHVVALPERAEEATHASYCEPTSTSRQAASACTTARIQKPRFFGTGGSLFGIHVVNVCLTIVTLSLYSFWAKVRIRKYCYSQTQFAGDRFAYHGTGRELLNGASKATLVFGLPYVILSNLPLLVDGRLPVFWLTQILSTLLVLTFLPVAITGARRYRFSRSSWRGIRFSYRGHAAGFIQLFLKGAILTAVTLGAYYPVFDLKRQAYLVDHSYIGNQRFSWNGQAWDLATTFACSMVLLPFTLGLSWFWYSAARQRYIWNHTLLGPARFACTMEGWPLLRLRVGNFLLLLCTLGLAWPWTAVRNARYLMSTLSLNGMAEFDHIVQEDQAAGTTGEGLSGFLDSGFDLG
ncbi:membrane protein [Nitrospira sp.]|nr:membrane protein [Nitrospira sp.]